MKKKERIYFENLDALRFLSFFAVFLFHSFYTEYDYISSSATYNFVKHFLVANGNLGVNFFFVLSGFLITYLLLKEKETLGSIEIFAFWKRRILRIWPLFFLCTLFGFLIFPQIKLLFGQQPQETANPIFYITFLNNFDLIKRGLPDASILGVLWSVAVEEQFYFLWPLILYVVPTKWYAHLFCGIILITLVFRAVYDNPMYNEYHTLSCIGDMTVGALGAWWVQQHAGESSVQNWNRILLIALYGIIILIFLFRHQLLYSYYPIRIFERTFIAFLFLGVILEQNYSRKSLLKFGSLKLISKLGLITYGLYCLQFVGILISTHITSILGLNTSIWQVLFLDTGLALFITIFIATLSYRYFETPFLKIKAKLQNISTREPLT